MKPFFTDHDSVVYQLNEQEEVEISHVDLEGDEFDNQPKPKQINRALAAYLVVHQKRQSRP